MIHKLPKAKQRTSSFPRPVRVVPLRCPTAFTFPAYHSVWASPRRQSWPSWGIRAAVLVLVNFTSFAIHAAEEPPRPDFDAQPTASLVVTEKVWFGLEKDGPSEDTAQAFQSCGAPSLVIGNMFDPNGRSYNLAIVGTVLYSGGFYAVHRWDACSGAYLGSLSLSSPLSSHLDDWLYGIGTTSEGNLLFTSFGYSTELRRMAMYSSTGTWIRDFSHSRLQHRQGTATGNSQAVFVASRYNEGSWTENILMFRIDGTYVCTFGSELGGTVGDVALMDNYLYALDYNDGVRVYQLNGTNCPTYYRLISFPPGVNPSDGYTDELQAYAGALYVEDDPDNAWYKISLSGQLLCTYTGQVRGTYNTTGSLAVATCGGCSTDGECDDGNACTDDRCVNEVCQHPNNSNSCNDGIFCNGSDTCGGGNCSQHTGNPCPGPNGDGNCSESCNEGSDNCTASDPNGSPCNDGLFCNGSDTCSGGGCSQHTGNPCLGPDGDGNCSESCNEPGGPPPLEVGEAMIVGGSHHQMIGQLPSQSILSTDSSPNS